MSNNPYLNPIPEMPSIDQSYSGQGAFRFWCQTVLPVVYDDSLSYYELLGKVVNYLNNAIEDLKKMSNNISTLNEYIGDVINDLQSKVDEINSFFESENFTEQLDQSVVNTIDNMVTNGRFNEIITGILEANNYLSNKVDTWLRDNVIIPEGGAVTLDPSLSTSNQAAPANVVGNGFTNIGNGYYTNNLLNREIGGNGYSTSATVMQNALLYQYIPLNMNDNKIVIYPKRTLENCYLRISITNEISSSESALVNYINYGTPTNRVNITSPVTVNYTSNNTQLYLRVSISLATSETLSTTADKDILTFIYDNNIVNTLTKEIKNNINNINNDITNIGYISQTEAVKQQRLSSTDGSGVNSTNSLLYGYCKLSEQYKSIVVWANEDISYIRVSFYSTTAFQSFIRTIRYDKITTPIIIPYTSEDIYMRISVTSNRDLDLISDYGIINFCFTKTPIYEYNKFNIHNFKNNLSYQQTNGYLIGANGVISASSGFCYRTFNIEPYKTYKIVFDETSATTIIRVHTFYEDVWIEQLYNARANTITDPIYINSKSGNNIRISLPITINASNMYIEDINVLHGADTLNLKELKSYKLQGAKVSVLGASISTFLGTIPEGYSNHYPSSVSEAQQKVKCINDMYWQKFINIIGGELLVNNSSAGRCCSTAANYPNRAACGNACVNLHKTEEIEGETITTNPDIIIIQVGGNDYTQGVALGDYVGLGDLPVDDSALESESVNTKIFSNAYAIMLNKILTTYPKAKVICGTIPPINQDGTEVFPPRNTRNGITVYQSEFNNRIRTLAKAFGCYIAEFYGNGRSFQNIVQYTEDDRQHPNRDGMSLMCNALLNTLGQMNLDYFNV